MNLNLRITPVISTGAYTAGDLVGGLMKFKDPLLSNSKEILLTSMTISDRDSEEAGMRLVLFNAKPDTTTFTDNLPFDPSDADLEKIVHVETLTVYSAFNDNSIAVAKTTPIAIKMTDGSIYACLVTTGTPTYTATTDIQVGLNIIQ